MTVLHNYLPSFCSYCEKETPYDGWSMAAEDHPNPDGLVHFYCDECGHEKGTRPYEDCEEDLKQEIEEVQDMLHEGHKQ